MKFLANVTLVNEGAIDIDGKPYNVKKYNENRRNELLAQFKGLASLPNCWVFWEDFGSDVVAVWGENGRVQLGTHGASVNIPRLVSDWLDDTFEWYSRPLDKDEAARRAARKDVTSDKPAESTVLSVEVEDADGEYSYTIRCRNSDMKDVEMFMTLVEDEGL